MHGSSARALRPDIDPLKPKYSNWREYIADQSRVFPVVWKDLDALNSIAPNVIKGAKSSSDDEGGEDE